MKPAAGRRPLKCPYCNHGFKKVFKFRRHLKRVHQAKENGYTTRWRAKNEQTATTEQNVIKRESSSPMAADLDDNNSHSNSLTINGNNGESINDTNEDDNATEDNGNNDGDDMEVGAANYPGEEDDGEEEPDDGDEDEHDAMDEDDDDDDDERDIDENIDSIKESKRKTLNGDLVAEDLSSRSVTKINDLSTNKNVSKLSSGAILETGFHSKSPTFSPGQPPLPMAGQKASTPNNTNSGMAKGRSKVIFNWKMFLIGLFFYFLFLFFFNNQLKVQVQ